MKILKLIYLFFLINHSIYCSSWVRQNDKIITSYIFAPGTLANESLISKYLPLFVGSTGECIICSKGIEVLADPASACNFPEINLKRKFKLSQLPLKFFKYAKKKAMYLISEYFNYLFGIEVKEGEQVYSLGAQWINIKKINLAQELDIESFRNTFKKHCFFINKDNPETEHNIVLYGISRGASTIFNFLALDKPKEVKAIICEGIFDSIPSILKARFPLTSNIILNFLEYFTSFKKNGTSPLENLNGIPLEIPILIITSSKDLLVPMCCPINLYKKLKDKNHKKVHLLILKNAGHNWYIYNDDDKKLYEQIVHAFYKYYNLPYIAQKAQLGYQYFIEKTQPNL